MDWNNVVEKSLGWMNGLLSMVFPWWGKVYEALMQAIIMVEKAGANGKKQAAIDAFEKFLVDHGYVPDPLEKMFDPFLDWGISIAIDHIVAYLNKHFGHDWLVKVLPDSNAVKAASK